MYYLVGNIANEGGCVCVCVCVCVLEGTGQVKSIWKISVPSSQFSVILKLLLKNKY